MPRIKETISQVGLNPAAPVFTPRGGMDNSEGMANLGKGIQDAGNSFVAIAEARETSDLAAKFAQYETDQKLKFKDTLNKADPNDPNIAEKYLQSAEDDLQKLGEDISTPAGREFYNKQSAQMSAYLRESAISGQAALAGEKAVLDKKTMLDSGSAGLQLDPTNFQMSLSRFNDSVDMDVRAGKLPSIKAADLKDKAKNRFAEGAVRGWIDHNANDAKAQLNSGKWDEYLNSDLKKQLLGEADTKLRADRVDLDLQRQQQERALKEAQKATQNKLLEKMMNGTLNLKRDVIHSNLEPFGSGSKEQFIRMAEANSEANKTDPAVFNELFNRIHAEDSDPKKIWEENDLNDYLGKGLSYTSLNQLRAEAQGKKTEEGKYVNDLRKGVLKQAKDALVKANPMMGIRDPEGERQYQSFVIQFSQEFDKQRKAGATSEELLTPESPKYLGNMIRNFQRTPEEIMKSMTNSMNTNVVDESTQTASSAKPSGKTEPGLDIMAPAKNPKQRLPGESISDWRKRTQGK